MSRPNKASVKKAIEVLGKAIEKDPGYREAWVANIAMQFKDHVPCEPCGCAKHMTRDNLHEIANKAANGFVDLLFHNIV